jgi:hypothetical protein
VAKQSQELSALDAAAKARLEADRKLTMSERLARVHLLSKQLTSIRGRARSS